MKNRPNRSILNFIFPSQVTLEKYVTACERYPLPFSLLFIILTILGGLGTFYLYSNVDTSLTALLPDSYLSVKTLKKIDQEGSKIFENVFIEGDTPQNLIAYAKDFERHLEESQIIHHVTVKHEEILPKKYAFVALTPEALRNLRDQVQHKIGQAKLKRSGFFITLDREASQKESGFGFEKLRQDLPFLLAEEGSLEEYFFSPDKKFLRILVYPNLPPSNLEFTEDLHQVISKIFYSLNNVYPRVKTHSYGPYRKRLDEYQLIKKDIRQIGLFSSVAILLSLFIFFRQFVPIVIILIPLASGLLWTLGFANLIVGRLNTITAFAFGILGGLGVDYCIHFYSRYLQIRYTGMKTKTALIETLFLSGRASLTSGLTTAVVFLALGFADFKGFSELGIIAGCGLMICYVAVFLMLPFLILWSEQLGLIGNKKLDTIFCKAPFHGPSIFQIVSKKFPFPKSILAFSLILIGIFLIAAKHFEFEYDFTKLRSEMISYENEKSLLALFEGHQKKGSAALMVMDSSKNIQSVRETLQIKMTNDPSPTIRGFWAFDNVYPNPREQTERLKIIREIKTLLDDDAFKLLEPSDQNKAKDLYSYLNAEHYPIEAVPKSLINLFSPRNAKGEKIGSYGYILSHEKIRTNDGKSAMLFAQDVRETPTGQGIYPASSQEVVFADVIGLMLKEGKVMILVTFLITTGIVFMDFLNLRSTILVIFPLTCSLMLTLLILFSFGGKITFFNMIVLPLIIGMGEDSTVHLLHRYLEEGKGSILPVLKTTGPPVVMATFTTVFGFMGLIFSHHQGLQSIGELATFGMLGCLLCSFLIFPALVQWLEDRDYIPTP